MWISTYEPGRELVLEFAPSEASRNRGCAFGCLGAAWIPTLIVAAAALSTGSHHGQLFFVWAPLAMTAVFWAFRLRRSNTPVRIRACPGKIIEYAADDHVIRTLALTDDQRLQLRLLGKDPVRGEVHLRVVAVGTRRNSRRSSGMELTIDGLGGEAEFTDFAHRLASILGFQRFATSAQTQERGDAEEEAPNDGHGAELLYSTDAPHEIPQLGPLPAYGAERQRSVEFLPDWGTRDLDEALAKEAEVVNDADRLSLPGRRLTQQLTARSSFILLGLSIGFGWLLWIALTEFEPIWLGGVLALGFGLCCAATAGLWFGVFVGWSYRAIVVDRKTHELTLTSGQQVTTIPFSSVRRILIDSREPKTLYFDTELGLISIALRGPKEARMALTFRVAELLDTACAYCEAVST